MEVSKRSTTQLMKKVYKGRKTTVFKKAKELSTLCDIDVLVILYDSKNPQENPQIWCSKPHQETTFINKYLTMTRHSDDQPHIMRTVDHSSNKEGCISTEKTREAGDCYPNENMSLDELKEFLGVLEGKIQSVNERINWVRASSEYNSGDNDYGNLMMGLTDGMFSCYDRNYGCDNDYHSDIMMGFSDNNMISYGDYYNNGGENNYGDIMMGFSNGMISYDNFDMGLINDVGMMNNCDMGLINDVGMTNNMLTMMNAQGFCTDIPF